MGLKSCTEQKLPWKRTLHSRRALLSPIPYRGWLLQHLLPIRHMRSLSMPIHITVQKKIIHNFSKHSQSFYSFALDSALTTKYLLHAYTCAVESISPLLQSNIIGMSSGMISITRLSTSSPFPPKCSKKAELGLYAAAYSCVSSIIFLQKKKALSGQFSGI